MLLAPEDRERPIRYLHFLDAEFSDYPKFAQVNWKRYTVDRDMRRNMEVEYLPLIQTRIEDAGSGGDLTCGIGAAIGDIRGEQTEKTLFSRGLTQTDADRERPSAG